MARHGSKPSNKRRRKILALLASKGGEINSGHDNLVGYAYSLIYDRDGYTHEQVTEFRDNLIYMDEVGDIELVRRDVDRKICTVRLPEDFDLSTIEVDEESSIETVLALLAVLQSKLTIERKKRLEAKEAADEALLLADSREAELAELRTMANTEQAPADPVGELACARKELAKAQERVAALEIENGRLTQRNAATEFRAERLESELGEKRTRYNARTSELGRAVADAKLRVSQLQRDLLIARKAEADAKALMQLWIDAFACVACNIRDLPKAYLRKRVLIKPLSEELFTSMQRYYETLKNAKPSDTWREVHARIVEANHRK